MKASSAGLWWLLAIGAVLVSPVHGQVNSWTNFVGGLWEDPSWSLGTLPSAPVATALTNGPGKTVTVATSTALGFPVALNLADVRVSAPDTQTNVLVLAHGTNVPFLTTHLTLGTHGVVSNAGSLMSSHDVSVSPLAILDQNSGIIRIRDSLVVQGVLVQQSGNVEAPHASAVVTAEGRVSQTGGTASFGSLLLRSWTLSASSPPAFLLAGGSLLSTNLSIGGGNSPTRLVQDGGTNASTSVRLEGFFSEAEYLLNSGALLVGSATVLGSDYNHADLRVSDGLLKVTNDLTLLGGLRHGATLYPGILTVLGGECLLGNLQVGPYSFFAQSNGTTHVAGAITLSASNVFARTTATLAGGFLAANELTFAGAGVNLRQTGGTLIVSNRLAFGGSVEYPPLGVAVYFLSGGVVDAPVMEIFSELRIESLELAPRVLNNKLFSLAGVLRILSGKESVGRLRLLENSSIHLGMGGSNTLRFLASAGEPWSPNAVLYLRDWAQTNQVVFGTNSAGLSPTQLAQVRFVDAIGFPGTNYARVLRSGEVVPCQVPVLVLGQSEQEFVVTWPGEFILLEAGNPQGPYEPVVAATSPFKINPNVHQERYYRLATPQP